MIKSFKNRQEKIAFLQALEKRTASLTELVKPKRGSLVYTEANGEVKITGKGGASLTSDEAKAIRNRPKQDLSIYVIGEPGGLAYQTCMEDNSTNPKSGQHIIYTPQAGNAPIIQAD
jgi:hypothetical protein